MSGDCVERKFDMVEYGILHSLIKDDIQRVTLGILHSQKIIKEVNSKSGRAIHSENERINIEANNKAHIITAKASIIILEKLFAKF